MKLSKATIAELREILKEEFSFGPDDKDLEKLSYSLVGYFSLLLKIRTRHKFGNSPTPAIDPKDEKDLDKGEAK